MELGVLSTIGRKMNAAYGTESLHLLVTVATATHLLSGAEKFDEGGPTLEQLERQAPSPTTVALADWQMTNRNEFRLAVTYGDDSKKLEAAPDWQMVSRWSTGQLAVERSGKQVTDSYALKGYWEGRQPKLLRTERFNCGALSLLPYSLLGDWATEQSPRAYWNAVFSRGSYEGVFAAKSKSLCHRAALITRNPNGSISRVFRIYVNRSTWRVEQIDEFGTALGMNNKVAGVVSNSWYFRELGTSAATSETFELHALNVKSEEDGAAPAQAAAARP